MCSTHLYTCYTRNGSSSIIEFLDTLTDDEKMNLLWSILYVANAKTMTYGEIEKMIDANYFFKSDSFAQTTFEKMEARFLWFMQFLFHNLELLQPLFIDLRSTLKVVYNIYHDRYNGKGPTIILPELNDVELALYLTIDEED
jgi:hypothetical protein